MFQACLNPEAQMMLPESGFFQLISVSIKMVILEVHSGYGISAAPGLYFARINLIQRMCSPQYTQKMCLIVFFCPRSVYMSTPKQITQARKTPCPPHTVYPLSLSVPYNSIRGRGSFLTKIIAVPGIILVLSGICQL